MLSVIVPYVREYPQIMFTLRSIHEELEGIEHEVLAIDNVMPNMKKDRGTSLVKGLANKWVEEYGDPWLRYIPFNEELSHWQCKNLGMKLAKGDIFWFVDAHCIVAKNTASKMYNYYKKAWKAANGSFHLPLTYHILEPKQLMYRMVISKHTGVYHYTFCKYERSDNTITEVPAMSTCGMMIHRILMDELGRWPSELGIYGGGENFINFTMAVLGMKKYIWGGKSLCHHGEERGYEYRYYDYHRNRAIASYIFGGRDLMELYVKHNVNISIGDKRKMTRDVLDKCIRRRTEVKEKQIQTIEEWSENWKSVEFCEVQTEIEN